MMAARPALRNDPRGRPTFNKEGVEAGGAADRL
jgi:hypothetical protein